MLCINVQNSDLPKKWICKNQILKIRWCEWDVEGFTEYWEKSFEGDVFFFMELSVLCAVWSVHFTNFFFDSKVFVAVHYISFAKGKTKRNQFVYIATLCRKQQLIFWQFVCVSNNPFLGVRFTATELLAFRIFN